MHDVDVMRKYAEILNENTENLKQDNRNDRFTQAYIAAMLWAETDEHDEPLENNYSTSDFHYESLESIRKDCATFQALANLDEIDKGSDALDVEHSAGHDFWLTRAGHGAGFWDGDWPEPYGDKLTELSQTFKEQDIYVGDDGQLHVM